jgi:hypothetical protein
MFWRWRFFATHGPDEKGSQAIFFFYLFFIMVFILSVLFGGAK